MSKARTKFLKLTQVLDGGQTLTLRSVTRHHAGKYRCHASNGVGHDAAEEIHLQVLCKYAW